MKKSLTQARIKGYKEPENEFVCACVCYSLNKDIHKQKKTKK